MKAYQHVLDSEGKLNCDPTEMVQISASGLEMFTWPEVSEPQRLTVEIEGEIKTYNMKPIMDMEPIILRNQNLKSTKIEKKKHLTGYLKKKGINEVESNSQEVYCVLNFSNKKFYIYEKQKLKKTIHLKAATFEENSQRNEFSILYDRKYYYFLCKGIEECNVWVSGLQRAKQLFQNNAIQVRLEPSINTRRLIFYFAKQTQRKVRSTKDDKVSIQCINFPQIIGISLINEKSLEIVHATIEKFHFILTRIQTIQLDESGLSMKINKQKPKKAILGDEVNEKESSTNRNNLKPNDKQEYQPLIKESLKLSIVNFHINNQIEGTDFPVTLVQKKDSEKDPFLKLEVNLKRLPSQMNRQENLRYFNFINLYIGIMRVKIDAYFISGIKDMYQQFAVFLRKKSIGKKRLKIQRFLPVETKLEERRKIIDNSKIIYIKRLVIEKISLILDYQSNDKDDSSVELNSILSDFKLKILTITKAKINLEAHSKNHIFGTIWTTYSEIIQEYNQNVSYIYKLLNSTLGKNF